MATIQLDTAVQYVKGVGPTRAKQLAQLGIETVEDLLLYFPFRFDLRKQVQPISSLTGNDDAATVAGEVVAIKNQRFGKRPFFQVQLTDKSGTVMVKWFYGGYLAKQVREGTWIAVSGKVGMYREMLQMINPRCQVLYDPEGTRLDRDELMPVYPAGAKLSSPMIAKIVKHALPQAKRVIPRWFPAEYLATRGLPPRPQAVAAMHKPEDKEHWNIARRRLAYDECLVMQLGIALMRMREVNRPAHMLENTAEIDRRIRARFPFSLTDAQDKAVSEIVVDLGRPRPMNRLLQGDVGSGKTVVALYACLLAIARKKQAAIMAPTEILARQHFSKVKDYLKGSRVRIALLVGGQPKPERERIMQKLADGEIDVVVGTHALLGEKVRFNRLALVVVDEQHKFGVRQRSSFRGKGFAPHYLVMTATPIPRTLAMTVFGDLDVSTIDTLPPGRGKTVTRCVGDTDLEAVWQTVREKLDEKQQAYFVYPLVTPSAELELTAAEEAYEDLARGAFKEYRLGLMHGQMKPDAKQQAMEDFRSGKVQALVASVVVEVGVDVPAANVMVVLHAERFGLAQLHQLRGRVGRSEQDALCLLVSSAGNPISQERLRVLEETSNGFKVAEEDLRLRGPGEIFGTRQHGLPELKVADLVEDFELLRLARRDAFAIVREDPDLSAPHHQQLRREVARAYADKLDLITGA